MLIPKIRSSGAAALAALAASLAPATARASEANIKIPDLSTVSFMGGALSGTAVLMIGLAVCVAGVLYGWLQYVQTKNLPVHASMSAVSQIIWETCKTYLWQQGKFLALLWILIAVCMVYYFGVLSENSAGAVAMILGASILGILGAVAAPRFLSLRDLERERDLLSRIGREAQKRGLTVTRSSRKLDYSGEAKFTLDSPVASVVMHTRVDRQELTLSKDGAASTMVIVETTTQHAKREGN
jgi:hypothetical protein